MPVVIPKLTTRKLFVAGLCLIVATGMVNIGIIGLDDYPEMIGRIIPAGVESASDLINHASIRSPIPTLYVSVLTRLASSLGLSDPGNQLRFALVMLGIFSWCTVAFTAVGIYRLTSSKGTLVEKVSLFLVGFYFISPLFLTRPMFESLAIPYLTLSAYWATRYWFRQNTGSLCFAVVLLAIAALFRFQAAVCVLAALALPLIKKRFQDLGWASFTGVMMLLITGLLDKAMRGTFHGSLRAYWAYNIAYGSSFGVTPFYTYALLFLAMTFPPLLWMSYRGFDPKKRYLPLVPVLLYFVAFLVVHSAVPHKEERFMAPIIPCFLMLFAPIGEWLIERKAKIRLGIFLGLNFLLLVLTSFNVAQSNVVGVGRYLHSHPELTRIHAVGNTLVIVPEGYVGRKLEWKVADSSFDFRLIRCEDGVAVRDDYRTETTLFESKMEKLGDFKPGILEAILIRLNPRQNFRRSTIRLYRLKGCSAVSTH